MQHYLHLSENLHLKLAAKHTSLNFVSEWQNMGQNFYGKTSICYTLVLNRKYSSRLSRWLHHSSCFLGNMIHPRVLRMLVPIMINRGKCAMRSSGLLCKVHRHQNATLLLPRSISVVLNNGPFSRFAYPLGILAPRKHVPSRYKTTISPNPIQPWSPMAASVSVYLK